MNDDVKDPYVKLIYDSRDGNYDVCTFYQYPTDPNKTKCNGFRMMCYCEVAMINGEIFVLSPNIQGKRYMLHEFNHISHFIDPETQVIRAKISEKSFTSEKQKKFILYFLHKGYTLTIGLNFHLYYRKKKPRHIVISFATPVVSGLMEGLAEQ